MKNFSWRVPHEGKTAPHKDKFIRTRGEFLLAMNQAIEIRIYGSQ